MCIQNPFFCRIFVSVFVSIVIVSILHNCRFRSFYRFSHTSTWSYFRLKYNISKWWICTGARRHRRLVLYDSEFLIGRHSSVHFDRFIRRFPVHVVTKTSSQSFLATWPLKPLYHFWSSTTCSLPVGKQPSPLIRQSEPSHFTRQLLPTLCKVP
jgi:hypothetical protein